MHSSGDLEALRLHASRFFACLLWLHIPVVAVIAATNGISIWYVAAVMGLVAITGTAAASFGGGKLGTRLLMAAALTAAPVMMVYTGRGFWQTDWHIYFFVVLGMLVAYVDWRPVAVAALIAAGHHVLFNNALFPASVIYQSNFLSVVGYAGIVLVDSLVLFWIVREMHELFDTSSLALQKANAALASGEHLKSVVVHANDAIVISEVPRARNGTVDFSRRRVVYVNEAFSSITGIPAADIIGNRLDAMIALKMDAAKLAATLDAAARHGVAKVDMICCLPGGRELYVEGSFVGTDSEDGTMLELSAILHDVTDLRRAVDATLRSEFVEKHNAALQEEIRVRKLAEERLAHTAYHDDLTDLPNRRLLRERLGRAIALGTNGRGPAILLCDFDRFKQVNDGLGHIIGDRVLVAIAKRLRGMLRDTDTLARVGGDEFTILIDQPASVEEVQAVAERTLAELAVPFHITGNDIYLTASIGIGIGESASDSPDDVLCKADLAVHRAKSRGKARYELFTPDLLKTNEHLLQRETKLRLALERSEIYVFYQPIIDLRSGRPAGFEALARWLRPDVGMIPPNDFIPLAEDTGLIIPLGRHILEQSCRELRRWIDALPQFADLWISVNVSPVQLREANYLSTVTEAIAQNGLAGRHLHLELTETTIAGDLKFVGPILSGLRDLGVHISIDDFGTGYSSLRYLDQLPIDSVKIDRSFVSGRGDGMANLKITQTIVGLARELGLDVVAEGIETEVQAKALRFLIRYGQGYLFARPMNSDAAFAYLKTAINSDLARIGSA